MKKANIIASIILLVFSVVMFTQTYGLPQYKYDVTNAATFPRIVLILLAALSIVLLVTNLLKKGEDTPISFVGEYKDMIIASVIILAAAILMNYLGFIISGIIICYCMLRLLGNGRIKSLIIAVIAVLAIYFLFTSGLSVRLPKGKLIKMIF